jgi:antitoxin CptB
MASLDRVELDRIRWRCRRGLLELDIVLGRFVDRHIRGLSRDEVDAFKEVLAYTDNDLWDVISARGEAGDPRHARIVAMLRTC